MAYVPSTALGCFMEPNDTGSLYMTTYPTVDLAPSRSCPYGRSHAQRMTCQAYSMHPRRISSLLCIL
eukprot:Awhi_evm1s12861